MSGRVRTMLYVTRCVCECNADEASAMGVLTVAASANAKALTLVEFAGQVDVTQASDAVELALDGCASLHTLLSHALRST